MDKRRGGGENFFVDGSINSCNDTWRPHGNGKKKRNHDFWGRLDYIWNVTLLCQCGILFKSLSPIPFLSLKNLFFLSDDVFFLSILIQQSSYLVLSRNMLPLLFSSSISIFFFILFPPINHKCPFHNFIIILINYYNLVGENRLLILI